MTTIKAVMETGDRDIYGDVLSPDALAKMAEQAAGKPIMYQFTHEIGRVSRAWVDEGDVMIEGGIDLGDKYQQLFGSLAQLFVAPAFTVNGNGDFERLVSIGLVTRHANPAVTPLEIKE